MKQINLQKTQNKLRKKFIKSGVIMVGSETTMSHQIHLFQLQVVQQQLQAITKFIHLIHHQTLL